MGARDIAVILDSMMIIYIDISLCKRWSLSQNKLFLYIYSFLYKTRMLPRFLIISYNIVTIAQNINLHKLIKFSLFLMSIGN